MLANPVIGRTGSLSHHRARLWLNFFRSGTGTNPLRYTIGLCHNKIMNLRRSGPFHVSCGKHFFSFSRSFDGELVMTQVWASMNLATSSIVDFESVLLRSTKELRVTFWCFLDGFDIVFEFLESVGSELHHRALNLSLEKLFLPVLTFRMAAGKVPGSLWRLVSWPH